MTLLDSCYMYYLAWVAVERWQLRGYHTDVRYCRPEKPGEMPWQVWGTLDEQLQLHHES